MQSAVWPESYVDYEKSPFFLRDSRASETRASVKITPREKRRHAAGLFSRGVIFTRARVSLAVLSLRKNGDYSLIHLQVLRVNDANLA